MGALHNLSDFLARYYGKKVIILLDEYDTPMQEAYVYGFWEELVTFTRNMFNAAFKTNPYIERGLMTGITRVSRESMFSDLNNLNVVTTSNEYGMMALLSEVSQIFIIHGRLLIFWIQENLTPTGQIPVPTIWRGS